MDTGPIAGPDIEGGERFFNLNVQPVNLILGYYTNAEHPDGGAEEQIRFQVNFMFPQKPK